VRLAVFPLQSAPLLQELAVFVEDRNLVEPFIRNVDVFLAVNGNARTPDILAVAGAVLTEFPDELFVT
jgi:hypothetical protein